MSDLIIEKLLEKRDSYLTIIKHLSFELMMDLTDIEIKEIKEVEKNTLDQLKSIQQEIAEILSQNQS
ncbi:MAG TPA: hypothetical protein HA347_06125 [Nitrosopumilus sp.]|nr:MAG: hypothetical protein ABR53_04585 [Nitrosopumilus sp. BACL13 MAG-121220-bin23]HIH99391.1 hypothetical protein [Nitrosopumilus sp.]HII05529.1 hypothetical protein [Nitrosopumilus sp.]